MKKIFIYLMVALLLFLAGVVAQRYWIASPKKAERKVLYWVAPMDSNYRRDKPGKSPMGMDLVPVYAEQATSEKNGLHISSAVENNLGVKTQHIQRRNLSREIDTVGHVTVDENNIEHIHTYTEGWIRVLNVKTTGEKVEKGQLLLELYSPVLLSAQEEFLLAIKNKDVSLIRAGEKKLLTLGMAKSQIEYLRKTRKIMQRGKVFATQAGIVSGLHVREGMFVKPDKDIMTIEDLSMIWMIADVFERQANWVKVGQVAMATLPYLPGRTWRGKVDYVYPKLDAKTRTLRVRLVFQNPGLLIKPNMYADVKILSQTAQRVLALPRQALIRTGEGDRVIVALGQGRYRAQPVKVGMESGEYYQVLSGLEEGDRVVVAAQFLIDSESNLKSGLSRYEKG